MNTSTKSFIHWFYILATLLSYIGFVTLVIFEVHVRWSVNQNFSFLGGDGLLGLALLALGQTLGLLYLLRIEQK